VYNLLDIVVKGQGSRRNRFCWRFQMQRIKNWYKIVCQTWNLCWSIWESI